MPSASELVGRAVTSPADVLAEAAAILAEQALAANERAQVLRAIGIARREVGDLEGSAAALQEATDLAGPGDLSHQIDISRAATRMYQGRVAEAQTLLRAVVDAAEGLTQIDAQFQLGTMHARVGEFPKALDAYRQALPGMIDHGETTWAAHLQGNRGAIFMEMGAYAESRADLEAALEFHKSQADDLRAVYLQRNLAELDHLEGDPLRSLRRYEQSDLQLSDLGLDTDGFTDKAHTFMAVGLFREALDVVRRGFAFHLKSGNVFGQLEAVAYGAEAAVALGDLGAAEQVNRLAQSVEGNDFELFRVRVELAMCRGRALGGTATKGDAARARRGVEVFRQRGDVLRRVESQLTHGEVLLAAQETADAAAAVAELGASVRRMPAHVQLRKWLLTARLRALGLDERRSMPAITAGLRVHHRLMGSVGNYESRVHASIHGDELLQLCVAERLATGKLQHLEREVEQYRMAREAHVPDASDAPAGLRSLLRELAKERADEIASPGRISYLERQIASEGRTVRPSMGVAAASVSSAPLERAPASLLTFASDGDEMHVVHGIGGRRTAEVCGSVVEIERSVAELESVGRRFARAPQLSGRSTEKLRKTFFELARELESILLPPDLADHVIISPDPRLSAVPWGALAKLRNRSVTIARARHEAYWSVIEPSQVFIAATNELEHAQHEARAVARSYRTASETAHLEGADVAHVIGHFLQRGDNPMLSSISVDGSQLTGYDFMVLRRPPQLLFLSGCSTGEAAGRGTDGSIGFTSAARAAGVRCVVATSLPLADETDTVRQVARFHELVSGGGAPADALRQLRQESSSVAAASLVAYGGALGPATPPA